MSVQSAEFSDPRGAVSSYTFDRDPDRDGIGAAQKQRQITRASNTGNVGATRQEGDDGPYVISWTITVFDQDQETALWEWYGLGLKQTYYLSDMAGETFEGKITSLSRQQIPASNGPGDIPTSGQYTHYTMEFEVWRFVSGLLADAGVIA